MTISAQIGQHLPFLRRYARALSGTQSSGDNYVAAMLEALIGDDTLLDPDMDLRLNLYRTLAAMWSSITLNLTTNEVEFLPGHAERNLQAMNPLPRQAFLLREVEGFTTEDVAVILDCSVGEVEALLSDAAREMAAQVATKVLIIEDEPLIAMDIEDMVVDLGHKVSGIARTHAEALELMQRERPGIVLADIQLADGSSGIDAVNDILTHINVPVVFITAYPERLLTGERPEPTYLVTKPFQPSVVAGLISQALFFGEKAREAA